MTRRGRLGACLATIVLTGAGIGVGAGPAGAAPSSYEPTVSVAAFSGGSELHVLWLAGAGTIDSAVQAGVPGGRWAGPLVVPGSAGTIQGGPAQTVAAADGEIVAVWRGLDNGIWSSTYTRSGWSTAPHELPGTAGTASSSPAVMSWRNGAWIDAYYRGVSGQLMEMHLAPTAWRAPSAVRGSSSGDSALLSAPTAIVSNGDTNPEVFWQGADGGIWETLYVPGQGWASSAREVPGTAGTATSAPAAVATGTSSFNIFWRDTTGRVDEISYLPGWNTPHAIPGTSGLTSAPTATISDNGIENDLLWEHDGAIYRTYWTAAARWLPAALADVPMSAPAPQPSPAPKPPPLGTLHSTGLAPITVVPKRRRGHVRVKVVVSWHWYPRRTRLQRIRLLKLPRTASVSLRCAGRGCPRRRWTARPGHWRGTQRRLDDRWFRAGDHLELTIAVCHERSERVRMTIRRGRRPVMSLR